MNKRNFTKNKCLKYYLDCELYGSKEIQQSIEQTKKEFSDKKVHVDITLNDFGMYVLTFYFENKNNYFNKINLKFKRKKKEKLLQNDNLNIDKKLNKTGIVKTRLDKYYGKIYGQYKNTGIYKPY